MKTSLDKIHNKLFLKAKYLEAELEEAEEIFEKCKILFLKEISSEDIALAKDKEPLKKCVNKLDKDLEGVFSDDPQEAAENTLSPSFKKLYKRIMIEVHPDKLIFEEDREKIAQYKRIYTKAASAANEGSWYAMLEAAMELRISVPDISEKEVAWLKEDCEKLNKKISSIKKTLPWVWLHSNSNIRNLCIKEYIDNIF